MRKLLAANDWLYWHCRPLWSRALNDWLLGFRP